MVENDLHKRPAGLFGPIDDTDRRRWQQNGLKGLTTLVQLGAKKKLPPLTWRLPDGGSVRGEIIRIGIGHDPREVFEAWHEALSQHPRVEPRGSGFQGEGPACGERTLGHGKHQLWAGYMLHLTGDQYPLCEVSIIAEWYAEDVVPVVTQ